MVTWIQEIVLPWLSTHFDIKVNFNPVEIKQMLIAHWQQAGNVLDKVVSTLTLSTKTILKVLINFVLVPVVTFYLLRDWPMLLSRLRHLVPRAYINSVSDIASQCNEVLGSFFRGQLLVMLTLGVYYTIGLSIIGLDLAVLIGLLIAFFSIVPFLGTIIGLILGVLTVVFQFQDIRHVIYLLIIFGFGHVLENMILTPLLIGDRVGLHPVAVIFAVLIAGSYFGFLGVLLAIPIAAILLVLLKVVYRHYINSQFYQR
jgi:predicted PurR-regulated permease PerM